MPQLVLVCWRDIPGSVQVRAGRKKASAALPERFEQAIDRAAMKAGMAGTDAYLSAWTRSDPVAVEGDDLEAVAVREAARIDAEYDKDRLKAIIKNNGFAPN